MFQGGSILAFTEYETEQLRKALLKETRRCAVTLGMKKTSVDQLTKAVGIAKGSFYKFYESKEMAFFAVLESIHSELYGVADHALSEANGLPPCLSGDKCAGVLTPGTHGSTFGGNPIACAGAGGCPIPATWFSLKTMRSCFCRDCRRTSKMSITTMTRRTFVCFWRNMTLFLNGGFHLLPRQYAD